MMKKTGKIGLLLMLGALLFQACTRAEKEPPRFDDLLVGLDGKFLTHSEVEAKTPALPSAADSARFTDAYVRDWIQEQLLFQQAEKNLPHMASIEKRVADYRRSLIMYEYQRLLVNERLAAEIPDSVKEAYYQSHLSDFKLEESLLRGIFVKVPQEAPDIAKVKRWMRKPDAENIEKIEKYSLINGVVYDYFPEKWVAFPNVMNNIPYTVTNEVNFVKEKKYFELCENGFWYLLAISDYLPKGATEPYDFAKAKIDEILVHQMRQDFLKSVEKDLYQHALSRDEVVFYQWRDTTFIP